MSTSRPNFAVTLDDKQQVAACTYGDIKYTFVRTLGSGVYGTAHLMESKSTTQQYLVVKNVMYRKKYEYETHDNIRENIKKRAAKIREAIVADAENEAYFNCTSVFTAAVFAVPQFEINIQVITQKNHKEAKVNTGVFIAIEYAEGETLRKFTFSSFKQFLEVFIEMINTSRELERLKGEEIVHADLNSGNIIIYIDKKTGKPTVRFVDRGLSQKIGTRCRRCDLEALEFKKGTDVTKKLDIWYIGLYLIKKNPDNFLSDTANRIVVRIAEEMNSYDPERRCDHETAIRNLLSAYGLELIELAFVDAQVNYKTLYCGLYCIYLSITRSVTFEEKLKLYNQLFEAQMNETDFINYLNQSTNESKSNIFKMLFEELRDNEDEVCNGRWYYLQSIIIDLSTPQPIKIKEWTENFVALKRNDCKKEMGIKEFVDKINSLSDLQRTIAAIPSKDRLEKLSKLENAKPGFLAAIISYSEINKLNKYFIKDNKYFKDNEKGFLVLWIQSAYHHWSNTKGDDPGNLRKWLYTLYLKNITSCDLESLKLRCQQGFKECKTIEFPIDFFKQNLPLLKQEIKSLDPKSQIQLLDMLGGVNFIKSFGMRWSVFGEFYSIFKDKQEFLKILDKQYLLDLARQHGFFPNLKPFIDNVDKAFPSAESKEPQEESFVNRLHMQMIQHAIETNGVPGAMNITEELPYYHRDRKTLSDLFLKVYRQNREAKKDEHLTSAGRFFRPSRTVKLSAVDKLLTNQKLSPIEKDATEEGDLGIIVRRRQDWVKM